VERRLGCLVARAEEVVPRSARPRRAPAPRSAASSRLAHEHRRRRHLHERSERRVGPCLDEVNDPEHEDRPVAEFEHVADLNGWRDVAEAQVVALPAVNAGLRSSTLWCHPKCATAIGCSGHVRATYACHRRATACACPTFLAQLTPHSQAKSACPCGPVRPIRDPNVVSRMDRRSLSQFLQKATRSGIGGHRVSPSSVGVALLAVPALGLDDGRERRPLRSAPYAPIICYQSV
jgi:hypothetical protein